MLELRRSNVARPFRKAVITLFVALNIILLHWGGAFLLAWLILPVTESEAAGVVAIALTEPWLRATAVAVFGASWARLLLGLCGGCGVLHNSRFGLTVFAACLLPMLTIDSLALGLSARLFDSRLLAASLAASLAEDSTTSAWLGPARDGINLRQILSHCAQANSTGKELAENCADRMTKIFKSNWRLCQAICGSLIGLQSTIFVIAVCLTVRSCQLKSSGTQKSSTSPTTSPSPHPASPHQFPA